jgi:Phosphotransferase enzyme family
MLIEQIVDRVFPTATTLVWNAAEVPPVERFWVVGGPKGPRWIIPELHQYGLPVLSQWRPYGASSYLKWQLLLCAYRAGQLHRLPNLVSIGISGASTSNWQHLGGNEDRIFIPTIYIGTPGITRKAVVAAIDLQQQTVFGVAKIPLEPGATANIVREAEILTALATAKPDIAPELLYFDRDRGITVQTAVPGKLVGKHLTKAHLAWLDRLYIPDRTTSLQEQSAKLRQRIVGEASLQETRLPDLPPPPSSLLERLLKEIDDSTAFPATWVHGDFAPWNLKWTGHRTLAAIDWEESQPNGLPLYDLFHYHYIQSYLLSRKSNILSKIWGNPLLAEYFSSLNINYSRFEKLALFYLANIWARSIENNKLDDAAFFITEISHILR